MMGVCFDEVRSSLESGKQLVWNGCNDKSVSECRSNGYLHSEARTGLLRLTSRSRQRSDVVGGKRQSAESHGF